MRYLLSLSFVVCILQQLRSQNEFSSFNLTGHGQVTTWSTDYQSVGINPANLDIPSRHEGKRYAVGFGEFGVSVFSGALSKDEVRKNIRRDDFQDLTLEQKLFYANEFSTNANSADLDVLGVGYSMRTNKLGSFGFAMRDRADFYSQFSPKLSELLWMGYNSSYFTDWILSTGDTIPFNPSISPDSLALVIKGINDLNASSLSEILTGSTLRFSWVREFNLSYGKMLYSNENLRVFGGVGAKYLVGQGYMQISTEGGNVSSFSALSPLFSIDYSQISQGNPSSLPDDAPSLTPVGRGWGFDFGATVIIKDKLMISAALNDVGSMTWDGNVYSLQDIDFVESISQGIGSLDLLDQVETLNGNDGLVNWQGQEKLTVALPAMYRAGISYQFHEKIRAGVDIMNSLNNQVGSLEKAFISVGTEIRPVSWLILSAGYATGGNYESKVPAGITFCIRDGGYELGVASRDMITFFTRNQPTLSMAFGFLRFRF